MTNLARMRQQSPLPSLPATATAVASTYCIPFSPDDTIHCCSATANSRVMWVKAMLSDAASQKGADSIGADGGRRHTSGVGLRSARSGPSAALWPAAFREQSIQANSFIATIVSGSVKNLSQQEAAAGCDRPLLRLGFLCCGCCCNSSSVPLRVILLASFLFPQPASSSERAIGHSSSSPAACVRRHPGVLPGQRPARQRADRSHRGGRGAAST